MVANTKKGYRSVYFDLDTKALQKYYPNNSWRNAYQDIRNSMESYGFTHQQGSVYHSKKMITYYELIKAIKQLVKTYDWFPKCVRKCSYADISKSHDLSEYIIEASKDSNFDLTRNTVSVKDKLADLQKMADEKNRYKRIQNKDINRSR